MAISSVNTGSVVRPSSPFDGDNVIDIREDTKFKLQLKTKAMLNELKNDSDRAYFQKQYNRLLDPIEFDISKKGTQTKLTDLKNEIETQYEKSISGTEKTVQEINDQIEAKLRELSDPLHEIDRAAEAMFDSWIKSNMWRKGTPEELEEAFNIYYKNDFSDELDNLAKILKQTEIKTLLDHYRFELKEEVGELFTKKWGTNSPIYRQDDGVEFAVDTNTKKQHEWWFNYASIERSDKKELVNSDRRKRKDRKDALKNILNTVKPKWINWINEDGFVSILKDILNEDFLSGIENTAATNLGKKAGKYEVDYTEPKFQKEFKKQFKKQFQEKFIKNDKYEKSGIDFLQRSESGKIADIVLAYQKGDADPELVQDMNRLIAGEELDIHYTWQRNAEYLLKHKVNNDNVFKFLCDFNSDGNVDSTTEWGDFWAVMGLQLYENLLHAGTTSEYDAGKKEYILIPGPETSWLIESILSSVSSRSAMDPKLKSSITYFTSTEKKKLSYTFKDSDGKTKTDEVLLNTWRDEEGNISIENFLKFMKWEFVFSDLDDKDAQKAIQEKLKTTAGYDIKEYLRKHGDVLNAELDLAAIFLKKTEIAERTLQASRDFYSSTENIKSSSRVEAARVQVNKSNVDRGKMREGLEKFADQDIAQAKDGIIDKMAIVAMTLTDHIFFNLGDNTEAWTNMFGRALGAISQTWFKDKDTFTRNKREIKNALWKYILTRMKPNISLSMAKNDEGTPCPVVGVSLWIDKLVDGKDGRSNRRWAGVNAWFLANLDNFKNSKFIFSVGIEKARQINKKKVQDLSTKKLVPVHRIGLEWGAGIDFKNLKDSSPYVGLFCERDPTSGIRQSEELYQREMENLGFGSWESVWSLAGTTEIYKDRSTFVSEMKKKISESNVNKTFLEEEIDQLADFMERGWLFDKKDEKGKIITGLLWSNKIDDKTKKEVLKYVYMAYIEWAKENASVQKTETLDKQFRLTRIGARVNVKDMVKIALGGAVPWALAGTLTWPWWTVIGAMIGATAASIRATRYENERRYDVDKGMFNYKTIGNLHALKENKEEYKDMHAYTKSLEHDVNGRKKYISVSGEEKENKWTITFSKDADIKWKDDILQYMNVYYSDEALNNGAFSYNGTSLTMGQTDFSTYKVINKDSIEVFLMIGNNQKWPMKQLTKANENIVEPKPIEKVPTTSVPMTKVELEKLQVTMPSGGDVTTMADLNKAYLDWLKTQTIPADLVNGKIIAKKGTDGKFSFDWSDASLREHIEDNKVELIYEHTEKIPGTWWGGWGETWKKWWSVEGGKISSLFEISKFSEIYAIHGIVDGMKEALRNAEKTNSAAYFRFMSSISNVSEGEQIDQIEIVESAKEVNKILTKNKEKFKKIIEILEWTDYPTISYILDELKNIFAKETKYTWKVLVKNGIPLPPFNRSQKFATELYGPSKETFSSKLQEELIDAKARTFKQFSDSTKFSETPRKVPNIIGYTAFYRNNKASTDNQRYSITAIGQTIMQWQEEVIKENAQDARKRFVENLRHNTYELALFGKMIESNAGIVLDNDQVITLLSNWELAIEDGKKKITLDSDMVFYLAGNCVNESIGIKINSITIEEKTGWGWGWGWDEEKTITYTGEIKPKAWGLVYKNNKNRRNGTLNSTYEVFTRASDFTVTGKVWARKSWWDDQDGDTTDDYVEPVDGDTTDDHVFGTALDETNTIVKWQ